MQPLRLRTPGKCFRFGGIVWGFWVGFRSWIFKNCRPTNALKIKMTQTWSGKKHMQNQDLTFFLITCWEKIMGTLINGRTSMGKLGLFHPYKWSSKSTCNWFFRGQKACSQQQKGPAAPQLKKKIASSPTAWCALSPAWQQTVCWSWICDSSMLGKKVKHILPNGRLIVIYHGTIRKKSPKTNSSDGYVEGLLIIAVHPQIFRTWIPKWRAL